MEQMQAEWKERYTAAVESFVSKVKDDPNVIAVIICGSLAYDIVWEKSDIDMTMVVRDQNLVNESYCITEDDILINVHLCTRSGFKRYVERNIGGSFGQSYFAKGKIIYTTEDTLYEYLDDLRIMGRDDMELTVFYDACELVHLYDKCCKWLWVKKDPYYAQYYLLKAAEVLAHMEVCLHGETPTRESIQKALAIHPEIIIPYYQNAMSQIYSEEELQSRIEGIDRYLEQNIEIIKRPAIKFMEDHEIKTVTLISKHFHRDGHFIVGIFDYLVEKGILEKASQTIRITPKSKLAVEELGYLYLEEY
ncbi:MAG: hypothetical protein K0S47_3529 [Herbinix sp.]|nr:hypothetical protein [Herbinix sp.]